MPLKIEWEPVYALPGLPEGCRSGVSVGDRLKVVFAGKEYVAVVSGVDVNPSTAVDKVKPAGEQLALPRVPEQEIRLWRQIASYYMCTVGEVYKMAYPVQKVSEREVERAETERLRRQKALEKAEEVRRRRVESLEERLAKKKGLLSRAKKDSVKERMEGEISALEAEIAAVGTAGASGDSGETRKSSGHAPADFTTQADFRLTQSQSEAYEAVKSAFMEGKPALLQGVTGSGKTEIYMMLADEALRKGGNVLYLVPEIALSRQLEDRLAGHFHGHVDCYHSALTVSEKKNVIRNVESGRPYVVLGTRSALFLPHRNLGLIIVDEEHDGSYKQDSPAPRYNGRDVALMLASTCGCNIILGSATPSLESLYNCSSGRFRRVMLGERFHGEGNTQVVLIDTNAERKKHGMVGSISRKLIELLKTTFDSGGQAMVLRARKSYSTVVQCSECGSIIKCPHCNVSLNLQKSRGRLVCNHCGFSAPWSEHVPHFRPSAVRQDSQASGPGSSPGGAPQIREPQAPAGICDGRLVAYGNGTEKVEEELAAIFPERRVARLDSDTSARAGWQKSVLKDFADRKIDMLVGTQMVAKGFDFDNLNLVAVLQADSLLGLQDFRADEKASQLLEQFRGRCARRGQNGIFAIQTAQPDHPVYRMLLSSRDPYTAELLSERKAFGYPPYTRLINIIMKDGSLPRLELLSSRLSLMLRGTGVFPGAGTDVTPPFAPAVDKVRDEHIRMIRVSFPKDRHLTANKAALGRLLRSFAEEKKYESHITVDVDPS